MESDNDGIDDLIKEVDGITALYRLQNSSCRRKYWDDEDEIPYWEEGAFDYLKAYEHYLEREDLERRRIDYGAKSS